MNPVITYSVGPHLYERPGWAVFEHQGDPADPGLRSHYGPVHPTYDAAVAAAFKARTRRVDRLAEGLVLACRAARGLA